jgi:hypothetical protein
LENYEREHNISSTASNELVEGAFNVLGAGLSLLAGSGKSKPVARIKEPEEDELTRLRTLRERLENERLERERNDPELKKRREEEEAKRRAMDSWGLETWNKSIDDLFDEYAEKIKKEIERAHYYKDDTKLISKLEKYRDKQKEIIRKDYGKTSYNLKTRNALSNFKYQCSHLSYNATVLSRQKNPIGTAFVLFNSFLEENKKAIIAGICVSVAIIFFYRIFIFQNIGIVVGSIITVAIMIESVAITSSDENKIAQILFFPILGAIGGFVVGGVAWLLSSFWTFVMVTWSIVMIIAILLAVSAMSDS